MSPEMTFYSEGKKPRTVGILGGEFVGVGHYGMTYRIDVAMGKHRRQSIIKIFKPTEDNGVVSTPKQNAQRAMENYQAAKTAGLKVLPTYRLSEDGTFILMTNTNVGNRRSYRFDDVLGANVKKSISKSGNNHIGLINGLFSQAAIAATSNIALNRDAFFFIVDGKSGDIDFVIGDLDRVMYIGDHMQQVYIHHNNLVVKRALHDFLGNNLLDAKPVIDRLQNIYESTLGLPSPTIDQG